MPVFPHRFAGDLEAIDWFGAPFGLVRFGDGERACLDGTPYKPYGYGMGTETWTGEGESPWRPQLRAALSADLPEFYIGVPPICCQASTSAALAPHVRVSWERRVVSTIFSYGNHRRFHAMADKLSLRSRSVLVAGRGGDIQVPLDAFNRGDWLEPTLEELFEAQGPILVAAGPAACVLIHQYWLRAPQRQVIVDIGSVLDVELFGHGTRMHTAGADPRGMRYHECRIHGPDPCHPGCRPSKFICP